MKKKLYYTVEKETEFINEVQECTGFKSITMYSIENNTPEVIAQITDARNEDDSQEMILDYLNDNGFGDDDFEMIQL
jgi:hypothetical protein